MVVVMVVTRAMMVAVVEAATAPTSTSTTAAPFLGLGLAGADLKVLTVILINLGEFCRLGKIFLLCGQETNQ
jgi:hypothetical protein